MEQSDVADFAYSQLAIDFGVVDCVIGSQPHVDNDVDEEEAFRDEMMQHLASMEQAELEERDQVQHEALQEEQPDQSLNNQRSRWRQTQLSWVQRVVQGRPHQPQEAEPIREIGGGGGGCGGGGGSSRSLVSGHSSIGTGCDSTHSAADASDGTVSCRRTTHSQHAGKPLTQRFWSLVGARAKA